MKYLKTVLKFIKREPVFTAAFLLAAVSFCIVRPGISVVEGIDLRTLALLYALMCVMAGFQRQFLFEIAGNAVISKINNSRVLYAILILLCFVSSMFLTNDVALITFVPFSVLILSMSGKQDKLPVIVVLQTIAANLGSVLTPLGNPQNLYLYNKSGMSVSEFVLYMLPLWAVSLVLVLAPIFFMHKENISHDGGHQTPAPDKFKLIMYTVLFVLCLLCVLKILDYRILLAIVVAALLIFDRRVLLKADYVLLLTFVGFFVFIYNIKQIPEISESISSIVNGHEFIVGVVASQVISNVPAAILLSGFTDNYKLLLVAVNAGGLGTLIASMASLISFKLYSASKGSRPGIYLGIFTAFNFAYLEIVCAFCMAVYKAGF